MSDYTLEACEERRLRIRISVAAYAYEYENYSVMNDSEFDSLCEKVDLEQTTGDKKLDTYFKKEFNPASGMWIRKHPNKRGLANLYNRYYKEI